MFSKFLWNGFLGSWLIFLSGQSHATKGFLKPGDYFTQERAGVIEKALFKVNILPGMHGTAFAISHDGLLLTNVHNISSCLNAYGYYETGYDGSSGPLLCEMTVTDHEGSTQPFWLMASHHRRLGEKYNVEFDFAVIKIASTIVEPLQFSDRSPESFLNSRLILAGFPGETWRSLEKLDLAQNRVSRALAILENAASDLSTIREGDFLSSESLFLFWLRFYFPEVQKLLKFSEFLSGSLLGEKWGILSGWQAKTIDEYRESLLMYFRDLRVDMQKVLSLIHKAYPTAIPDYQDADDSLRISEGKVHHFENSHLVVMDADARPGSSGSPVLDEHGKVFGIVFGSMPLDAKSSDICLEDMQVTSLEAPMYQHCSALGIMTISGRTIKESLRNWGLLDSLKSAACAEYLGH